MLVMSEGLFDAKPAAFYDLYRIEDNKMVDHWDVVEAIPPKEQCKSSTGKFSRCTDGADEHKRGDRWQK